MVIVQCFGAPAQFLTKHTTILWIESILVPSRQDQEQKEMKKNLARREKARVS